MGYKHIGGFIKERAAKYQQKNALYYKGKTTKDWIGISWIALEEKMQKTSKALVHFGIQEHQNIAIFSQNKPEWIIADLAIMAIRGVTVPLYATNSKAEVEYIVNDAEISVLFVGEQEQFDKAIELSKTNKYLKLIVAFDTKIDLKNAANAVYFNDFVEQPFTKSVETELQKRYYESELDDLASIIYTSGTTGEPKGVMLNHHNFSEVLEAHDYDLNVTDEDTSLGFLPLSHVYERTWVLFCLYKGVSIYINQNPKLIAKVIQEVKPTLMCTVPRIFEKIYAAIDDKSKEASPIKKKFMVWGLKVGNNYYNWHKRIDKPVPFILKLKYKIAHKLVLSTLQGVFGGRIKFMPCGGAPLSKELVKFFHSFGLNIKCGYGLTETTATVSLFSDTNFEFNSAGKPLKGTQIKIGENNEILVKGPGVMQGYYKKPEETVKVFKNGWFCTGDAGKIDEKGNLIITDRIKDLMKTSGGKYIAPQKLETALINDSFIEQIAVIGDQQKYVTALAVPSFENLKEYALKHKINFNTIEELIAHNQIKDMFEKRFEELQREFSVFEKIKKFTLLPKEFSIEAGEITATLKLKRKVIEQRYHELIKKMYAE
jgi:long-chain acyl-CoA synthetase